MFMNTIAVGPLDPAEFCVTGGTTVAIDLSCAADCFGSAMVRGDEALRADVVALDKLRESCPVEYLNAIGS